MAHSMLSVGDRREWFRDLDLLLVVRMSLAAWSSDRSSGVPPWLLSRWFGECEHYAPGTLRLEFDRIAKEPSARAAVLWALSHMELALRETSLLTGVALNRDFGVRGVRFDDRDPATLVETVTRIRELIAAAGA